MTRGLLKLRKRSQALEQRCARSGFFGVTTPNFPSAHRISARRRISERFFEQFGVKTLRAEGASRRTARRAELRKLLRNHSEITPKWGFSPKVKCTFKILILYSEILLEVLCLIIPSLICTHFAKLVRSTVLSSH